jgi:hypothetical protein
MNNGRLVVIGLAAVLGLGTTAAVLEYQNDASEGQIVELLSDELQAKPLREDDGADQIVDEDDQGDGDNTRGDDATAGGNNTPDGDDTDGNDGTQGGDNTPDRDSTGGNDGTGGGDNTPDRDRTAGNDGTGKGNNTRDGDATGGKVEVESRARWDANDEIGCGLRTRTSRDLNASAPVALAKSSVITNAK